MRSRAVRGLGADVAIVARGREALDDAVKEIGAVAKGQGGRDAGDVGIAADIKRAYDEAMRRSARSTSS